MTGLRHLPGRCAEVLRRLILSNEFREVLLYCIPALLVGFALRVALTARMPYGYVQYDSAEYLETPFRLLRSGSFFVDGKRGFLVPILFTIPFLLHLPALIVIPLGQHLLGLLATVMSGALTRLWFRFWRWFIIPVTLYVAANPSMLWYEQTIMGESEFLFSLIFLALAGTLWAARPSRARFCLFLAALVCTAGARPEGRLFFAFGLALAALMLWGQWRKLGICVAVMLAIAMAGAFIVRQSTAPQLLYASLIQLAPDHSRFVPGIELYITPLRDQVRRESGGDPLQLVKVSKQVRDAIDPYLWTQVRNSHMYYKLLNKTLRNLCLDAIITHPIEAFQIPLVKFRLAVDSWSAYQFNESALHRNQVDAYTAQKDHVMFLALARGMTGRPLDEEGIEAFVSEDYRPEKMVWFGELEAGWNNAFICCEPRIDRRTIPAGYMILQVEFREACRYCPAYHGFTGGTAGDAYRYDPSGAFLQGASGVGTRNGRSLVRATLVGVTNARYRLLMNRFALFIYVAGGLAD